MTTCQALTAVADEVGQTFYQREAVAQSLVAAAVAREHVLLLGPPGTGKSEIVREFTARLDGARLFDWLLTKYSQPDELFGPISITAFKEGRFERLTTGKLPECEVAFLDEVFKANGAILNALLMLANERRFHNGRVATDVPLRLIVGASNELPDGDDLGAFYDRFLVRHWIDPIRGMTPWCDLMRHGKPDAGTTRVALDDLDAAHQEAMALTVDGGVVEAAYKLKMELEQQGVVASDRRWVKAFKLARAMAWLDGSNAVETEHCRCWQTVLWNDPEQAQTVATAVRNLTSPNLTKAIELFDAIAPRLSEAELATDDDIEVKAAPLTADGKRVLRNLQDLHKRETSKSTRKRIKAIGTDLRDRLKAVRARVSKAYHLDEVDF